MNTVAAILSTLVCGALFWLTGWIDIKRGYDTFLRYPCTLFFWATLLSVGWVFVSLWLLVMSLLL